MSPRPTKAQVEAANSVTAQELGILADTLYRKALRLLDEASCAPDNRARFRYTSAGDREDEKESEDIYEVRGVVLHETLRKTEEALALLRRCTELGKVV